MAITTLEDKCYSCGKEFVEGEFAVYVNVVRLSRKRYVHTVQPVFVESGKIRICHTLRHPRHLVCEDCYGHPLITQKEKKKLDKETDVKWKELRDEKLTIPSQPRRVISDQVFDYTGHENPNAIGRSIQKH